MIAERLSLGPLFDYDGILKKKGFSGIFICSLEGHHLDRNCGTTMFARLGLLVCWVTIFFKGDFEVSIIGLQGLHNFRCLFAEGHRNIIF